MANYNGTIKTNYFRVTDEEKYKELFSRLTSEFELYDFSRTDEDGTVYHAFGSWSEVMYTRDNGEDDDLLDIEEFGKDLQKILPEDDAFIYTEVGYEKLRYLVAYSMVVTRDGIDFIDLPDKACERVREILGNPDWETKMHL